MGKIGHLIQMGHMSHVSEVVTNWPATLRIATVVAKHDRAKREHVIEGFNVLGHRS